MGASLTVEPVSGALGAEVVGVDLSTDLPPETIEEIRGAFHEHHVLFFRDQDLTPATLIAFGRRFGSSTPTRSWRAWMPTPR